MSRARRRARDTVAGPVGRPTGHVFRVERKRGAVWYAKYRLPDGRQVQRKIGPAWSGRGRPAAGFVKRLAEDWLRSVLEDARRGTLPGLVRTGDTFADAAAEWLSLHRARPRPEALDHRRLQGDGPIDAAAGVRRVAARGGHDSDDRALDRLDQSAASTRTKAIVLLHGIFARASAVAVLAFLRPARPAAQSRDHRLSPGLGRMTFTYARRGLTLADSGAAAWRGAPGTCKTERPELARAGCRFVGCDATFRGVRRGVMMRWLGADCARLSGDE